MADQDGPTNGRGPNRRPRKHIYPPPEQMAAEQAAATTRGRTATRIGRSRSVDAAPPVTALAPVTDALETGSLPELVDEGASYEAENVELSLSAVGMVEASDVQFTKGAMGAARADSVSVDQGALGVALADKVEVSRGYARTIIARQVQLDRAAARVVVAADVKAERTAVMFLVARRVAGDVRVLLDWRGAIAFGAVAGTLIGLLRRRPGAPAPKPKSRSR